MGLAQYSKNAGRLLFCDAVVGAMRKQELRTLQLCGLAAGSLCGLIVVGPRAELLSILPVC